jgi:hypothetical protein
MTARINSLQHSVAVFGAVLFTLALVTYSSPVALLA